jgi:hypothetical protein
LPNVFTAIADILLGYLFTHEGLEPWPPLVLLIAASSLVYMAGMALNDYFDRQQDARERPARPVPSGRVSARSAWRLGVGMLVAGQVLGWLAGLSAGDWRPGLVVSILALLVLLYDGAIKRTVLGPLAMGSCRFCNVLLGMSLSEFEWSAVNWVVAGGIGIYVTGITIFARREALLSGRWLLTFGVAVMLAGIALLASLPRWTMGLELPPIQPPANWLLFWGLMALWIAGRFGRAIVNPQPKLVQSAVRGGIFSLVVLDAAVCLAVQPILWGAVILALLVPTMFLGRWIYST